jgi:AFG3 family protein
MKDNKLENPKPIRKIPNKKITPKPPKPNIMWFYAIIVVVLLVVATLLNTTTSNPITFQKFGEMLKQHDVEKVVAYRSGDLFVAEVYIKKESLNKQEYADAKKDTRPLSMGSAEGPQYTFSDATYEGIKQSINNAEKDFGFTEDQKVPVSIEPGHESLLSNWFVQCIIMAVLLVAVWLFIMRRMSGGAGGGPGGQIFNIGKSKATLFDKEAQVSVTFNDVAGLEEAKQEVMEIVDFLKNPKKYTNLGVQVKPCWLKLLPAKHRCLSSPCQDQTLLKCLLVWALRGFVIYSARQKTKLRVLYLLTKLTPLAVPVVKTILLAVMMNAKTP